MGLSPGARTGVLVNVDAQDGETDGSLPTGVTSVNTRQDVGTQRERLS